MEGTAVTAAAMRLIAIEVEVSGMSALNLKRQADARDLCHDFPQCLIRLYRNKARQEAQRNQRPPFIGNRRCAKNRGSPGQEGWDQANRDAERDATEQPAIGERID